MLLTAGVPHALVVSDSAYMGAPLPAALVRSMALYTPPTAAGLGLGDQAAQPATAALPHLRGGAANGPASGAAASSGPAPALEPSQAATSRPAQAQPQLRGARRAPAAGPPTGSGSAAHVAAAPDLAQQGAGVGPGVGAPASASAPTAGSAALAGSGLGAHAGAASAVSDAPNPGQGDTGPVLAPQAAPQRVGRHGSEVSGGFAGGPANSLGSVKGLTIQAAGLPADSRAERDALSAAPGPAPAPAGGGVLTAEPPGGALAAAPDQARERPEAPPTASAAPALQVGAYAAEGARPTLGAKPPTETLHPGGTRPSRAAAAVRAGAAAGPTVTPATAAEAADGPAGELNVGSYPGMERGAP